jgi:hypothetical protein
VVVGVVVAAAVALLVVKNVNDRREQQRLIAELTAGSCEFDRRSDGGSEHIASPVYRVDPPSGGDHTARAAGAGRYSEASAPGEGELVHAMEHGYVILWHRPDITDTQHETVDDIAATFDRPGGGPILAGDAGGGDGLAPPAPLSRRRRGGPQPVRR